MEANAIPDRYSGMDLKLKRVAADVRTNDLAMAMGVTDSRISYIEGRRVVTAAAAERYLAALATFTTSHTDTTVAS